MDPRKTLAYALKTTFGLIREGLTCLSFVARNARFAGLVDEPAGQVRHKCRRRGRRDDRTLLPHLQRRVTQRRGFGGLRLGGSPGNWPARGAGQPPIGGLAIDLNRAR